MNIHESSRVPDQVLQYLEAVKFEFQYHKIKYDRARFCKLLRDLRLYTYTSPQQYDKFLNLFKARVKRLFKECRFIILGLNIFMPKEHQIEMTEDDNMERSEADGGAVGERERGRKQHCGGKGNGGEIRIRDIGKKVKKVEKNSELPWDVLDIISKTLDFEDLFQFSGVCKYWRAFPKIYWRNFLASQEPLLLQISCHDKESYSFISIPDQKVYHLEMMQYFPATYISSSGGYFIIMESYNPFLLINPFTRIKKVINAPKSEVDSFLANRALLAFSKCSEEFVFVILCKGLLHVYQSRNCDWVTYPTVGNSGRVVDFVVLHNIIYVVTDKFKIGVLSLNSATIKFLKLSSPYFTSSLYHRLVNCDEQLLVVDITLTEEISDVYKIDFSTMNFVKLETLGNIALFYVSNGLKTNCYALSNPNMWGYESNSVYAIGLKSRTCSVYSGDDKKLQKCITLPTPISREIRPPMFDWCFKHLQYEVDYSLVE